MRHWGCYMRQVNWINKLNHRILPKNRKFNSLEGTIFFSLQRFDDIQWSEWVEGNVTFDSLIEKPIYGLTVPYCVLPFSRYGTLVTSSFYPHYISIYSICSSKTYCKNKMFMVESSSSWNIMHITHSHIEYYSRNERLWYPIK